MRGQQCIEMIIYLKSYSQVVAAVVPEPVYQHGLYNTGWAMFLTLQPYSRLNEMLGFYIRQTCR